MPVFGERLFRSSRVFISSPNGAMSEAVAAAAELEKTAMTSIPALSYTIGCNSPRSRSTGVPLGTKTDSLMRVVRNSDILVSPRRVEANCNSSLFTGESVFSFCIVLIHKFRNLTKNFDSFFSTKDVGKPVCLFPERATDLALVQADRISWAIRNFLWRLSAKPSMTA